VEDGLTRNDGARRPPALLDRLLSLLLPRASRDAVMGDLWERYRSPGQFAAEGMRTVPHIVASRARRTSSAAIIGLQLFILGACLGSLDPGISPRGVPYMARAAIPGVLVLLALILRNVYRGEETPVRRGIMDAVAAVVAILASQLAVGGLVWAGMVQEGWLLRPFSYVMAALALPILCMLGTVEGAEDRARHAGPGGVPPAGGLTADYAAFRRRTLGRNRTEMAALAVIIGLSSYVLWTEKPDIAPFGWSFVTGYILLTAYLWRHGAAVPAADTASAEELRTLFGTELTRQHRLRRLMWWFWFVPLFAGIITHLIKAGIGQGDAFLILLYTAAFAGLAGCIAKVNADRGRGVRLRIEAIEGPRPA